VAGKAHERVSLTVIDLIDELVHEAEHRLVLAWRAHAPKDVEDRVTITEPKRTGRLSCGIGGYVGQSSIHCWLRRESYVFVHANEPRAVER
jgi:hypothetical protein